MNEELNIYHISEYDSALGKIVLCCEDDLLAGLWFFDQKYFMSLKGSYIRKETKVLADTKRWLDLYFSGKVPDFIPDMKISGTAFQERVYELLLEIPYGHTSTYKEIGERIYGDRPFSSQAIGNAIAHNPISILIPCHRVIGSDGSLKGYAGGLERKRRLLDLESRNISE